VSRRRLTWLIHNTLTTPFIAVRLALLTLIWIGEAAEGLLQRMPGWRRYNGWSGW